MEPPAPTPDPVDEVAVYTSLNLSAFALVMMAVALIAGLSVMAFIVNKLVVGLANSQPAFAAPIFSTGNAIYKAADQVLDKIQDQLASNDVTWDDQLMTSIRGIGRDNWKKFIEEAKAKGVVLPDLPAE